MTPETKAKIQQEAEKFAIEQGRYPAIDIEYFRKITTPFIAGATLYAEQVDELEKENERLKALTASLYTDLNPK